jgi:hypothetical protein
MQNNEKAVGFTSMTDDELFYVNGGSGISKGYATTAVIVGAGAEVLKVYSCTKIAGVLVAVALSAGIVSAVYGESSATSGSC